MIADHGALLESCAAGALERHPGAVTIAKVVNLTVELHVGIVAGRPAHAREVVRGSVVAAPPPLLTIRSMVPLAAVESVVAMMVVLQTVQQFGPA